MLQYLFALLRGYTTSFNDFEIAILEAVSLHLSEPLQARLEQRVAAIRRVHRLDGGREVIGYEKRNGKVVFPEETRLTAAEGSTIMASFAVYARSSTSRIKGKIWLNCGNVASLEFNLPTEHAEAGDIERVDVTLAKSFQPLM